MFDLLDECKKRCSEDSLHINMLMCVVLGSETEIL